MDLSGCKIDKSSKSLWLSSSPFFKGSLVHGGFLKPGCNFMHVVMTRVIEEAQFAQDAAGGAGVELQADFLTAIPVVQREKALCLNFICQ